MERQLTGYRNRAFVFFTNPIIQFFFFLGGGGGGGICIKTMDI